MQKGHIRTVIIPYFIRFNQKGCQMMMCVRLCVCAFGLVWFGLVWCVCVCVCVCVQDLCTIGTYIHFPNIILENAIIIIIMLRKECSKTHKVCVQIDLCVVEWNVAGSKMRVIFIVATSSYCSCSLKKDGRVVKDHGRLTTILVQI